MKRDIINATSVTFMFLVLGAVLLYTGLVGYGLSVFAFLPFTLGLIFGGSAVRTGSLIGLVISFVVFLALLIVGRLEGMVCLLMALPFIIGAIALGMFVRHLFNKSKNQKQEDPTIKGSLVPIILFVVFGVVENQLTKNDRPISSVSTEIILPYSPMEVYETIKSVDTLDAEKPFLMKFDLPVPQKCVLEAEKVGGIRTCYFEGGTITERITELEKGKILKMDVIDYDLPVGRWLGFHEAIYTFEEVANHHCKLTRITTYSSQLYPRFYWQPLEHIGIQQEHEYVFNNLKKDLKKKFR